MASCETWISLKTCFRSEFLIAIVWILQVELSAIVAFEGISPGASGSQSGHRTSLSTNTNPADVLSVNELLESVIHTFNISYYFYWFLCVLLFSCNFLFIGGVGIRNCSASCKSPCFLNSCTL